MQVRRAMAAVAVLLAMAACTSNGDDDPPVSGATVPTAAPTTTTTNPYAVPAVIDAAYVNRVLAAFDELEGNISREIRRTRSISPETIDKVKSFHTNLGTAEVRLNLYQVELSRGFPNHIPEGGNTKTVVSTLITARASCIYAQVDRDSSAVVRTTNPAVRTQWVALRPMESNAVNQTGWGFEYNGLESNLQAPRADPCAKF